MQTITQYLAERFFYALSAIAAVFILIYFYVNAKHKFWKNKSVPYEKPVPIIGTFWSVYLGKVSLGKYLQNLYESFSGPYFGIYVFDKPFLVLRSPELIKKVLIKDFEYFCNKNFGSNKKADPLTANGLFMMKNSEWKTLRIKLTPVFTPSSIKLMFTHMIQCGKSLYNYLSKNDGNIIEMKEMYSLYTIDVIASCAFGLNTNSFENENADLHKARRSFFNMSYARSFQMFSYFFAPDFVKYFNFRLVDSKHEAIFKVMFKDAFDSRIKSNTRRNDLVDLLLDIQKETAENKDFSFGYEKMVAQAVMFYSAGFETTSSAIAFLSYELAMNTEIQNKVRAEIKESIRKHSEITYETIQELKYTEQVIEETLRKYPLIPFINREVVKKYTFEETGLTIDKNVTILIPIQGLHYDEDFFPNPHIFDPDRFGDGKVKQGTFLSFGDGPRYCIGKRLSSVMIKVGLIYLLQDFELVKSPKTPDPVKFDPKIPILYSTVGLPIKIRKLQ